MKGFKTVGFNLSLIIGGLFEYSGIDLPPEMQELVSAALMTILGVPHLNGPAMIILGVIGIALRSVTTSPMGRQRYRSIDLD